MKKKLILKSLDGTRRLAALIAARLKPGDVVTLRGDLGTGKSELARALIRTLMQEDINVPSPTFTLVQTYDTPKGELWHFDFYRIEDPEEADELGLDEALSQHMVVMEWPEKLGKRSFKNQLDIHLSISPVDLERHATVEGDGKWGSFVKGLK